MDMQDIEIPVLDEALDLAGYLWPHRQARDRAVIRNREGWAALDHEIRQRRGLRGGPKDLDKVALFYENGG